MRVVALVALLLGLALLVPAARGDGEPFTRGLAALSLEAPGRRSLSASDCARCHEDEAREWRSSRHRAAFTNPVFQAAWDHWPNGWCLNCHLPLEEAQAEITGTGRAGIPGVILPSPGDAPPGGLAEEGVSCVVCHVRDGQVLSPERPSFASRLFHPIREEPALHEPTFCAGCHEFPFQNHTPRWPFSYGEERSQATLSEWRQSRAAAEGQRCQDCHMPQGRHSFPGAHDAAFVRGHLSAHVNSAADATVSIQVTATGAAHAVPTGDPFRRLVVELCADARCAEVVGQATLRRGFESTDQSWREVADTRVPPATEGEAASRRLVVPVTAPARAWRLWLYYGDSRFHDALPEDEVRLLVAEGEVHP